MDTFFQTTPDLAPLSPRGAFQYVMRILRGALPAPEEDTPADWAERDHGAVEAVAALQPANAAEARLAAECVTTNAWALDCMRLAQKRWREPSIADKCRAQAMGMLREGKKSLRALERMQAARRATEADPAAAERAAWIEHGVARMMEAALPADAGEDLEDGHTEGHGGDFRAEVVDVAPTSRSPGAAAPATPGPSPQGQAGPPSGDGIGSVSDSAINPQDMSRETEVGLWGGMPGAAGSVEAAWRGGSR